MCAAYFVAHDKYVDTEYVFPGLTGLPMFLALVYTFLHFYLHKNGKRLTIALQ